MSQNVYLTFSGSAYHETTRKIVVEAPRFGADRVIVADDAWLLKTPFYERNKWLWDQQPRYFAHGRWNERPIRFGFGWCSWKAYLIRYCLERLEPGDIVLYTDADTYPVADLRPIFDYTREHGVMLFEEQGFRNKPWTKRDCFIAMGCDVPECHESTVAGGRFQAFRKDAFTDLLDDWDRFSVDPRCQLWDRSVLAEDYPGFMRHSTEQSVLSNLAFFYEIPLHRSPDQAGGSKPGEIAGGLPPVGSFKDWDLYGQVLVQQGCAGDRGNTSGSRLANIRSL